jgi:integrase
MALWRGRWADRRTAFGADFHSIRHLFVTSPERAGISPEMAQALARHSDIRLTLGVDIHVELHDQTAAIESLPGPPGGNQHATAISNKKSVA